MSKKPQPRTFESIYLKPPPEIDQQTPLFANNVRVLGSADSMIVHLYYVSPTRLLGAQEGRPQEGIKITDNMLVIEAEPVARVALPLSTATELAMLIFRTIVQEGPELATTMNAMAENLMQVIAQANRGNSESGDETK